MFLLHLLCLKNNVYSGLTYDFFLLFHHGNNAGVPVRTYSIKLFVRNMFGLFQTPLEAHGLHARATRHTFLVDFHGFLKDDLDKKIKNVNARYA